MIFIIFIISKCVDRLNLLGLNDLVENVLIYGEIFCMYASTACSFMLLVHWLGRSQRLGACVCMCARDQVCFVSCFVTAVYHLTLNVVVVVVVVVIVTVFMLSSSSLSALRLCVSIIFD